MKFLSSVGIGLSVVFCCLLLALVVETCYLLWWKRRIAERQIQDNYGNPIKEILCIFCWRSTNQDSHEKRITEDINAHQLETGFQFHANSNYKDLYPKAIDENCTEAGIVMGPPRFLFTIKEETKEDLESEEGKVKGVSRRLSDLMRNEDSSYITPLSSPSFFAPPLIPIGYNPLLESSTDVEFNKMRSSPPPKFKFLRDAEKLQKKNAMEDALW